MKRRLRQSEEETPKPSKSDLHGCSFTSLSSECGTNTAASDAVSHTRWSTGGVQWSSPVVQDLFPRLINPFFISYHREVGVTV